jgi:hypothetical protein
MNHVARALVYFEITAPLCIENMNPAATRERIDRVLAGSLAAACDRTHTHTHTHTLTHSLERCIFIQTIASVHTFPYADVMHAQLAFSQRNQETAARKSAKKLTNSRFFVSQKCLDGKVMTINYAARVIYFSKH